ncbi:MAG: PLP-dependent aminotransferase family protein [Clostridia bacterium]|nr:PLP-dependent aminotransferase family protein [Clostridia bacterium]
MLTYSFEHVDGPIYEHIYKCIKGDILSGKLKPGEKLPTKRTFARNNSVSTITIQNAYDQLISEGYVYTVTKKGYYVAQIRELTALPPVSCKISYDIDLPKAPDFDVDLSGNDYSPENFPFSVWTGLSREVMSTQKSELMRVSPIGGAAALREAIAEHLRSFRGMMIDPDQIVIGAGTEYLYGLLADLLGNDKRYAIESPGYKKLAQIYGQRGIRCHYAGMDSLGIKVDELLRIDADIAHICPNHHFPTGITMPANRRYEILAWANEKTGRYIIEDDYDSEFRTEGKPIPTLFSIDACEKVIYMNTFSKSIAPTIRISYMVLPVHLVKRFYDKFSFYSCTVSNFEQYTLAAFIERGCFEKHINRMRLHYMRKRKRIIEIIKSGDFCRHCDIMENDSGLHFLLRLHTDRPDREVEELLAQRKIRIKALSDYDLIGGDAPEHHFILNYSNITPEKVEKTLSILAEILTGQP